MPGQEPILQEADRSKLDGIVQKMVANKETDETIQAVVNDFKSKYAKVPEPVKKKEETSGLAVSPSGSLETKPAEEPSTLPSESDTQYQETIFDAMLGGQKKSPPKDRKKEFVTSPAAADIADEKGSLLSTVEETLTKGKDETAKAKVHERVVNFRNNFFNGSLTPEDVDLIPGDLSGLSSKQAAEAINNKTKNLKIWGNVSVMRGLTHADLDYKTTQNKIDQLKKQGGDNKEELKALENKKAFLSNSINQVYNAEADKTAGELISTLKNSLDGPIKYDQYTNTVDEKSQFYIRKAVDDYLNTHKNDVINYKTSGDTVEGKRNYPDVANRVVNYFNTVIPVQRAQDKVAADIITKYPEAKGLITHAKQVGEYFTKDNVDKADAAIKSFQDKGFLGVNEKYYGQSGRMTNNVEFAKIQNKYKQAVANKEMPEDVAMQQMEAEVKQNKSLMGIFNAYQKEVDQVQSSAKKMWEDYLINGLKKIDPSLTMYKNGNVGIEGMNQEDSKKIMDEYNADLVKATATTLHDQHEKLNLRADQKAKRVGAFGTTFAGAINDMQGAFSKFWFDKTGWGGQAVEMYQAKRDANVPSSESDEARKWNWQGMSSLKDPNFYKAAVGSQIPLFGGLAAVTAATRGAGLPQAIQWLSVAGLFDGSMAVQSYNDIVLNGKDKFGNKLTEHDAAVAAAGNFKKNIVPDMLFAAANLGILSRAKNLSKPTLFKTLGTATTGLLVGSVPMTWQGYNQYATQLEAEGKKPDIWDYAQDGKFAHSLIEGIVGGAFLQLFHTPMDHIKRTENWKRMIVTSDGEFKNNSMFSLGLQHEMSGLGNQWRDAMKMKIATEEMTPVEKEDVKNTLLYSTALEKNIKGGGIDISNVKGAYQAHSLALADLHDQWAKQNEENPSLSKIYTEQASEFRKQAKNVMEGKGKYHYLTDVTDQPIFLSDQSFKVLDANGILADWIKSGTIEGVHSSDEPNFDSEYKEKMKDKKGPDVKAAPVAEATVEPDDQTKFINSLREHREDITGMFKFLVDEGIEDPKHHEDLTKEIISQAVDHPTLAKDMLGPNIWKKIEPIVTEKTREVEKERAERAEVNKKTEVAPEEKEAATKVLKQKIEGMELTRKARKEINFEGKKVRADIAIEKLKDRHSRLEDVINCL